MKGEVLHYDDNSGTGQISGADGIRYNFTRADLKRLVPIAAGSQVDFDFEGKSAHDIFVVGAGPFAGQGNGPYNGPTDPDRGMFEYFMRVITANYFNFSGRARRKEYWSFYLFSVIVYLILGIVIAVGMTQSGLSSTGQITSPSPLLILGFVLIGLFLLGVIIPSLALLVRRFHDLGQTGWLVLLLIVVGVIPLLNILGAIASIVVGCLDSQPVANKWGVPPKPLRR